MEYYKIIKKIKRKKEVPVYYCLFCNRDFSTQHNVKRHIKQAHRDKIKNNIDL